MLHFGPNLGSNDMAAADNKETLEVENGNFWESHHSMGRCAKCTKIASLPVAVLTRVDSDLDKIYTVRKLTRWRVHTWYGFVSVSKKGLKKKKKKKKKEKENADGHDGTSRMFTMCGGRCSKRLDHERTFLGIN